MTPVDSLCPAPAEEKRRPPGVGPDRMRRTPGALQTTQEVTGLAVHDEPSIQNHPQLRPVEGRNSPLGPELEADRLGHVANVTEGSDKYLILRRHVGLRPQPHVPHPVNAGEITLVWRRVCGVVRLAMSRGCLLYTSPSP